MSVQLTINQFSGSHDNARNFPHLVRQRVLDLPNTCQSQRAILGTGGKFKDIQNANEMPRKTILSILSHPAIEHLVHFLFLLLLKYFSGDERKKTAFLEQAGIGITPSLLDKTAPSDSPAVSCFFFLVDHKYFC